MDMVMKFEDALIELKKGPVMSFATSVNDQPYVRFMALVNHEDKFYCVTYKSRPKTHEIQSNSNFAFAVLVEGKGITGSIRCRGRTEIIIDPNLKKEVAEEIPWHSHYWDYYDDPEFTLIRLNINHLIIFDPETKERTPFDDLNI